MENLSVIEQKRYNINQKILQSLADYESRMILFQIVDKAKTSETIKLETQLPQSSVYKKLNDLEELGLAYVEKQENTYAGRIIKFYRSKIKEAAINIKSLEPNFTLIPTE